MSAQAGQQKMAIMDSLIKKFRFGAAIKALDRVENENKRPLLILDAGGGLNTIAPALEKGGHRVIACDKAFFGHRVVLCDLEEGLPIGDKSFDVVLSLAVVEHLDDWEKALSEFKRVGKCVILTTPSPLGERLLRLFLRLRLVHPMTAEHKKCLRRRDLETAGYRCRRFLCGLNQIATFPDH